MNESAASTGGFIAALEGVTSKIKDIGTDTTEAIAHIHRLTEAQTAVTDAEEARALAQNHFDQERGKINSAEAAKRADAIKQEYAKKREDAKTAAADAVINAKGVEFTNKTLAKRELDAKAGTEADRINQKASVKNLEESIASQRAIEKQIGTDQEKGSGPETLFEARKKLDKATKLAADLQSPGIGYSYEAAQAANKQRDDAQKEYDDLKTRHDQAKSGADRTQRKLAEESNKLTAMDSAAAESKNLGEDLARQKREITQLVEDAKVKRTTRAQVEAIQADTNALNSAASGAREIAATPQSRTPEGQRALRLAELADQLTPRQVAPGQVVGGHLPPAEGVELTKAIREAGGNTQQRYQEILEVIKQGNNNSEGFMRALDALKKQQATTNSRLYTNNSTH